MKRLFILFILCFTFTLCSCYGYVPTETATKEIITKYDAFFEGADEEKSIITTYENVENGIEEKAIVKNSNDELLGYLYTMNGKNPYGDIVLLVSLDVDGNLIAVKTLMNNQSFAQEVENHINDNYITGLTLEQINNIDIRCGATYSANTVKELVLITYEDYNLNK